jgi:hypothetical protein
MEVVANPILDKRGDTEGFEIAQAFALPKGVYFHRRDEGAVVRQISRRG